ncbi:MAG: class I SAM-dependent methyltransferase [Hormoscilla sp. GUM202]|nr:class I SAM-dependent methyltransferase [Hormoscilla sp. GUM202]
MKKISYNVKLPSVTQNLEREEEYFILVHNNQEQRLKVRDYEKVYKIPGLYEYVLVELLKHTSHQVISELLVEQVTQSQLSVSELSVLELGSGVGLVGACLKDKGVKSIVGVDLIEEAAEAAKRDRPNVYNRYYVEELPHVTAGVRQELENSKFNCLVCASALTGGLPGPAFAFAYNLIADGGPIACNIREDLLDANPTDHSSGKMLANMIKEGIFRVQVKHAYRHRLSVTGVPLYEVALIGFKMADIPKEMMS